VYQDVLGALYEVFFLAKKDGLLGLEDTVNNPEQSQIFSRHPAFLRQKHALHFLCDSLKLMVDGSSKPSDLEVAMDTEIETLHEAHHLPVHALARVADALPGMGIVAAVMGVVIAVQGIDGPPAEIGHKIGAALVGTFLGILLSYGFVGPMSTCLEHAALEEGRLLQVIKTAVIAFCGGAPPAVAVDLARRSIFPDARPSSTELNEAIKSVKQLEAA
jgi:chemotaxis protein MotA